MGQRGAFPVSRTPTCIHSCALVPGVVWCQHTHTQLFTGLHLSNTPDTPPSPLCFQIQFGSATEVDITNYTFVNVVLTAARKAAISIVSMDGANISNIKFENISIQSPDIATPLYVKIGNRAACEDGKGTTRTTRTNRITVVVRSSDTVHHPLFLERFFFLNTFSWPK